MGLAGDTFSPQLPERFDNAADLYQAHGEFKASLEKIASHVVGGGSPMTFALYGDWGTGKSTALAYLRSLIEKGDPAVTFSWCEAPLWARYDNERSALALQILRGVGGEIPATVAKMLGQLLRYDKDTIGGHDNADDYDLAASLAFLEVLNSIPHAPPVVEEWIRRYITRNGSVRHVVILDDLDRCDTEFASRLLKATNYWTSHTGSRNNADRDRPTASIYFILACRQEFLVSSQEQRGEISDPRQSLEKYVHVSVAIPRLLRQPRDAADYLRGLVTRLDGVPVAARDRLTALIEGSGASYPDGLFEPLVRIAGDASTPRAIKTRLNHALTEMDFAKLDNETLVKEWIIKAFWPDFWVNQYRSLLGPDTAVTPDEQIKNPPGMLARFEPLHAIGTRLRGLLGMSDDALAEALTHVAVELHADLSDVTPQLAIYLASEPVWPARPVDPLRTRRRDAQARLASPAPEKLPVADQQGPRSRGLDLDMLSSNVNPRAAEDNADASGGASGPADRALPGDPDDQILFFYLAADSAEDNDDQAAVEENLERLLEVARWRGPETDRGTTIGNAALIAERTGLPVVALELHRLARAAEPGHYNIMQNYIDFVLDVELADEYPEAERLYNILMTDGKDHRPFRTLILGIRLDSATLEAIPNQEERIHQVLAGVTAEPTAGRFFEILKLRPDVLGWDALRSAARTVAESADDPISRSTVLQLLAAALGRSSNHVHEREVADMGRWFLTAGLACRGGNGPYAGTFYNIALQLGSLGYRRAATLAYAEAYRLAPLDPDSRRALATSLERLGRNEDATAVLLGRSIDLGNIQPEELPPFLSTADQTERWWEGLDVGASEPCPTELGWLITRRPAGRAGDG